MKIPGWDKNDFGIALEIRNLLENKGYKALANFWLIQREEFIKRASSPDNKDRDFNAGVLHGFNVAMEMAEKVISEANRQAENKNARKTIDEALESR